MQKWLWLNLSNATEINNIKHLIEVRSISYNYENSYMGRALNAVSFFVNSGERVAILGHNGSGKSTLVKILGGLLENFDGECLINGINIKNIDFIL